MPTIADRLTELRAQHGLTRAQIARRLHVVESSVFGWERGRTVPKAASLAKLAELYGVSEHYLLTGESGVAVDLPLFRVKIIGEVQAGAWKTALQWPASDQYEIMVSQPKVPVRRRYGLVVRGTSMNLLYPDGTTLVCVPLVEFHRELFSGDKVIVERVDGDVVEATVKELGQDDEGQLWLWPRSSDPEHQVPIPAPVDRDENQDSGIRIVGVVVQSVRNEMQF